MGSNEGAAVPWMAAFSPRIGWRSCGKTTGDSEVYVRLATRAVCSSTVELRIARERCLRVVQLARPKQLVVLEHLPNRGDLLL
jgi:hypothetical protein